MNIFVEELKKGNVIGIETDTVIGLATLAENIDEIYKIKQRDYGKPLIMFISDVEQISNYGIELNDFQLEKTREFWPGANTLIFENNEGELISFRIPKSDKLIELINAVGEPLYTTSANVSGMPPAQNKEEFKKIFPEIMLFETFGQMSQKPSNIYIINKSDIKQIR